jgi:hypothetical protein
VKVVSASPDLGGKNSNETLIWLFVALAIMQPP